VFDRDNRPVRWTPIAVARDGVAWVTKEGAWLPGLDDAIEKTPVESISYTNDGRVRIIVNVNSSDASKRYGFTLSLSSAIEVYEQGVELTDAELDELEKQAAAAMGQQRIVSPLALAQSLSDPRYRRR